jgi:hypothetical protein
MTKDSTSARLHQSRAYHFSDISHNIRHYIDGDIHMWLHTPIWMAAVAAAAADEPLLRFARTYGDNMVFQHGGVGATVWGYAPAKTPTVTVSVSLAQANASGQPIGAGATITVPVGQDGTWHAMLPAHQPGMNRYTVTAVAATADDFINAGKGTAGTASAPVQKAQLTGVLFGDVWVCSGQSNMDHPMTSIINASAEIAAANAFVRVTPNLFLLPLQPPLGCRPLRCLQCPLSPLCIVLLI